MIREKTEYPGEKGYKVVKEKTERGRKTRNKEDHRNARGVVFQFPGPFAVGVFTRAAVDR